MASKGFDLNCVALEADEECGMSGVGNGGSTSRVLGGGIGDQLGVSSDLFNASGINLVVDLDSPFNSVESKVVFNASDLVWGKVRGYPWWPGLVVDPSAAASEKAKRKKDSSYLIAYFGDENFVWSDESRMKPFEAHFSEMSKQSNDSAFCQAVNVALEEYSRRIQAGLACPCLPEDDAVGRVKLQVSARVYGGETVFQPGNLVAYLQALAKSPQVGDDALKLATAKAHLASFYRSKGYNEPPSFQDCVLGEDSGLKEDDLDQMIDVELDSGDDYIAAYGKRKSPSTDVDQPEPEPLGESKKPRLDLMSGSSSSVQKDDQGPPSDNSSHVQKPDEPFGEAENEVAKSDSQEESAYYVPVRRGRGRPRKAAVEKAGSSPSFPNGQKESEVKSDRPKEPACSLPVHRGPGRPPKKLDFISGSSLSFQNAQKESELKADSPKKPACSGLGRPRKVIEIADPLGKETVKESEGAESVSVQPVRRGRGRPRKTAVRPSESEVVSSLTGEKYQDCPPTSEILAKLRAAAASPMEGGFDILSPVAAFLGNFQKDRAAKEAEREARAAKEAADKEAYEAYEEFKKALAAKEAAEGYCPTGLIFKFSSLDKLPSVSSLNEIYGKFGPLEESETKVLHKSKRLVFLFKRRCDAERAFSSSGKYAVFGPALDSYRLDYEPTTSKSCSAKHRRRK